MNFILGAGGLTCLIANVIFYLGCPNQQWVKQRPFSFKTGLFVSSGFAIFSVILFNYVFSVVSAIYTVITLSMLVLGILPFLSRYPTTLTSRASKGNGLERDESYKSYKPQWLIKIIGMTLVGYPFALTSSSLFSFLLLTHTPLDVKSQFLMWLIVPLWLTPLSLIFFTKKPIQLFLLFILLTAVEYTALQFVR